MDTIYLPENVQIDMINSRLKEHDQRLNFERNYRDGNYSVFVSMPHGEDPFPVFAFYTIPSPDEVMLRIHKADTLRAANNMYNEITARNAALRKQMENAAKEASDEAANRIEHASRPLRDRDSVPISVFIPGKE